MNRTTAYYLGASAALVTALALACPSPPPPAEEPEQADIVPAYPESDVPRLRSVARFRLAAEVLDGRRSVFAAAALFRALDQVDPALDPHRLDRLPLPVPFPAATEDERYCRLVARVAYLALEEDEARAAEVVARLAAEVRAQAAVNGSVRLPDPATLDPVDQLLAEARAWRANHPPVEK